MFLDDKIIRIHQQYESREELLKDFAQIFVDRGNVTESFPNAILERENSYPTGLQFARFGIAIPHADSEHVKKPQIGFMSLTHPVPFRDMVENAKEIPVSLVVMMALEKSEQQIEMLQKLIALFQDEELVESLISAQKEEEVRNIFEQNKIS